MKCMVIVKATKESEAGVLPSKEMFAAMGQFNEELVKAGVMKAGEGLKPTSQGKRVCFGSGGTTIKDGPFAETRELVAGFWIWEVKSMEEAVEWLRRAPFQEGDEVEIRPFYEVADFGEIFTPELREQEERLRAEVQGR